jgi:NADH-quinone oxidoreductase subunit A
MESQLQQYFPVLVLFLVAVGFAGGTLVISALAGKLGRRTKTKDIPYECGMLPEGPGNSRLSVKFYLVALLFVLFDIEVVFMYPWAVVYKELLQQNAALILGGMVSFLGVLVVGYVYALKKGAFDWTK